MTEISLDGEPIFVDVANDPQFPILYTQLLQGDDTTVNTVVAANKANSDNINTTINQAVVTSQTPKEPEQDKRQTEAINACIKIENRRLKCPECKRWTCETEEKMLRHIRKVHRGENPFQCYMCEYSTYNKAVFEEHVRVHQGIKPFKCSYCDYKSASKKNAKKHEQRHNKDNSLRCPDCNFIAQNSASMRKHKKKHDVQNVDTKSNKTYECDLCKRKFTDRKKKNSHWQQKKKCTMCAYITCSKMLYLSHLEFDHGIPKPADAAKLFACAICPWSSNSKPRILLHLIHHPNQTVNEDIIDITVLRKCGIME